MQAPRNARIPVSGFFAELAPIAFQCAGFEYQGSGQGQGRLSTEPALLGFGTRRALCRSLSVLEFSLRSGAYVTVFATEFSDA